jgi:hypothetical protein
MDQRESPEPEEDAGTTTTTVETVPIHNIRAWLEPDACSSHGTNDYCFLCCNMVWDDEEEEKTDKDVEGSDDITEFKYPSKTRDFEANVTAVKRYITIMAHQGFDVTVVVENTYTMYNTSVRPSVPDFIVPSTGAIVKNPAWSKNSILDHLMNSSDPIWATFFSGACTVMLRKLVLKAADSVVDKKTGKLLVDQAELLCKFIERHDKHMLVTEQKHKKRRTDSSH